MSTILIIDDNQDYRTGLAELLAFEKYHTLEAENGLEGLQMIRRYLPDLIICDVDMPVMDGIEVLKTVKADASYAKIPFIVSTGRTDMLTMQALQQSGADICLTKPTSILKFLETVGGFLWKPENIPDYREDNAIELRMNLPEAGSID